MTGRAQVDLVQRDKALGVVGDGLDHRQLLGPAPGGGRRTQQGGRVGAAVTDEDPRVAPRVGVDAHHRLSAQVLGGVGDQAVLADHDHHVLRGEQEAVQVGPLHPGAAPGERHRRRHLPQRVPRALVAADHLVDRPAPAGKEERGLPVRPVPGEQFLVLGPAVHEHRPRGQAHAPVPPSGRPSLLRSPVRTSGESVMLSIRGRFSASRVAARACSVPGPASSCTRSQAA